MKFSTGRIAISLLVIALSTPALAQEIHAAKACNPASTSGKCLLPLITTLQGQVATLQTALSTANTNISALQTALTAVQNNHALALGPFFSVDAGAENGLAGPNIIISGANVHIESGSGNTSDSTGLGNLVIGYDEDSLAPSTIDPNRTGSHNLVVGEDHQFTASGGAVFGFGNFVSSNEASITGGSCNAAGATAFPPSLAGPCFSATFGIDSVSGGEENTSNGGGSSVSGGLQNTASGQDSSVSGGNSNSASGIQASVSGGFSNTASKDNASVSGGESNTASGDESSILGGNGVTVSTKDGHSP